MEHKKTKFQDSMDSLVAQCANFDRFDHLVLNAVVKT
jgi:hypothetical protein